MVTNQSQPTCVLDCARHIQAESLADRGAVRFRPVADMLRCHPGHYIPGNRANKEEHYETSHEYRGNNEE